MRNHICASAEARQGAPGHLREFHFLSIRRLALQHELDLCCTAKPQEQESSKTLSGPCETVALPLPAILSTHGLLAQTFPFPLPLPRPDLGNAVAAINSL